MLFLIVRSIRAVNSIGCFPATLIFGHANTMQGSQSFGDLNARKVFQFSYLVYVAGMKTHSVNDHSFSDFLSMVITSVGGYVFEKVLYLLYKSSLSRLQQIINFTFHFLGTFH